MTIKRRQIEGKKSQLVLLKILYILKVADSKCSALSSQNLDCCNLLCNERLFYELKLLAFQLHCCSDGAIINSN